MDSALINPGAGFQQIQMGQVSAKVTPFFKRGYAMINPILLKDRGGEGGGTHSLNAQIWYYFLKMRKVSISSLANSQSNT